MKITVVLGAFFPVPPIMGGAVEKVWFVLAREFARRGHRVVQISRTMPQLHRRESIAGVQHVRVRGFDAPRSLLWLKFLDLIYSARVMAVLPEADILVTNTFWLPILLRSSKHGKIYVHVARYPKGQMRFYRKAARLQAPSGSVASAILAEAPQLQQKIEVIPYPVPDSENQNETPPLAERSQTILFVGRVHPEKGVHLLIEAFASLPRELASEWKLSIVGPAEEGLGGGGQKYFEDLKRSALKAAGNVFFLGPVFEPAALERNFRSARLFVYPSLADLGESFGLAPLEAMAHGCPVIVSNLGCFQDFIREGETGFVFDHHADSPVKVLRETLQKAMTDSELLARVAEAGYRESAKYSVSHVADQFLHDFSSLTAQSDAAGTDH
jgi:glycosyltransferase involved in cell wall biosynthesis